MKKKVIIDVFLNVLATSIPVLFLQFILLPVVASKINANSYGYLITIVAWLNLSALTLGNVLNNSRLIFDHMYREKNINGDYNILLCIFLTINFFVMLMGLIYFKISLDILNILTILFTSFFMLIKGYILVEFRIKLNYKLIFFDSIYITIGYGVGFLLFSITGYWQFIYLSGSFISFLFVFLKTNLLNEPLKRTPFFKRTSTQTFALLFSGVLNAITEYADKFLIFPLLGGLSVSVYYSATILGKTIALAIGPITGVFLSYLSRLKTLDTKYIVLLLLVSMVAGSFGYSIVILLSEPILNFLYPQFVEEAMKYINITTITIIIGVVGSILNAVILKFCDMRWQITINGLYLVVYIVLSLILLYYYGLIGFCIGILLASIMRLLLMFVVYYITNVRVADKAKG